MIFKKRRDVSLVYPSVSTTTKSILNLTLQRLDIHVKKKNKFYLFEPDAHDKNFFVKSKLICFTPSYFQPFFDNFWKLFLTDKRSLFEQQQMDLFVFGDKQNFPATFGAIRYDFIDLCQKLNLNLKTIVVLSVSQGMFHVVGNSVAMLDKILI